MKKKIIALGILGVLLFSSAVYGADYWIGNGGRGVNLAVLVPEGRGLSEAQAYLTTMVQGVFVADLSKYSAMSVIDRANLEKVLKETESGAYREEDFVKLGEINVDHVLTGSLTKTSTGFSFQIQITGTKDGKIKASYSGTCTVAEFDNYVAIKRASIALLKGMGISLTAQGKAELQQAAAQQTSHAQADLAKGIVAQRNGSTIEAQMLYYQAAAVDPLLMEAANRASIVSADIRTGNIGENTRNDIQWRKDWEARLVETERYFDTFFKNINQPYALIYTPELKIGDTNYKDETAPVSFTVELRERSNWTDPVLKTVNDVWQGLTATERKTVWGFESWPASRVSNVSPFSDGSKRLTIVVELVNEQKKVIGRQTFEKRGWWNFSFSRNVGIQSFTSSGEAAKTITFPAVKANDLTDGLTLQFTTVNNVPVADASRNGLLMITTRALYRDAAGFDYWGYDKNGYGRDGFNREGRTVNGSLYERWSPLSSALELLYTFRPGSNNKADNGLTVGLWGAYGSFFPDDFVLGYTLNLLSARQWGLGLPLGVGRNNLENQLVLETGLQLRFWHLFEIRGTYRTIGFSDNSFTISVGGYLGW
jgi:TolB-like protein